MATNTTHYDLVKPATTDQVGATITALAENFDKIDTALYNQSLKHYKWVNVKAITTGNTELTLDDAVVEGDVLIVKDTKYGFAWFSPDHWSASGTTITFTEMMTEDMTFEIICLD